MADAQVGLTVDAKVVLVKQVVRFVDATSSAVFHGYHGKLDNIILNSFEKLLETFTGVSVRLHSKVLFSSLLRVCSMLALEPDFPSLFAVEPKSLIFLFWLLQLFCILFFRITVNLFLAGCFRKGFDLLINYFRKYFYGISFRVFLEWIL